MFLQACVILFTGGGHAWLQGGACVAAGGGMHGCKGACMVAGGVHGCRGGVHGCRWCMVVGVCMVGRGHAWLQGGMHGGGGMCGGRGGMHGIQ